jgi:hypothetical protein
LQLCAKNGGKGKPEYRIPALIFGSFFVPIGLLYVICTDRPFDCTLMPSQLVWLVRASEDSLDNAHHWIQHLRIWDDDDIVRD